MNFNASYIRPRKSIIKLIEGNQLTILDVGCANGANGKYLIENSIASTMIGFEYNAEMAEEAKKNYDQVFVGDLDELDILALLNGKKFDYVLFGDVLEHLKDPWNILKKISIALKPKGKIILSIPNVQHIDVFIHVYIKGVWPHNERGIFDKTHLRFFTKKTILELIDGAGLEPIKFKRVYRLRDKKGSKFRYSPIEWLFKYIFKNIYTFQYIYLCETKKI